MSCLILIMYLYSWFDTKASVRGEEFALLTFLRVEAEHHAVQVDTRSHLEFSLPTHRSPYIWAYFDGLLIRLQDRALGPIPIVALLPPGSMLVNRTGRADGLRHGDKGCQSFNVLRRGCPLSLPSCQWKVIHLATAFIRLHTAHRNTFGQRFDPPMSENTAIETILQLAMNAHDRETLAAALSGHLQVLIEEKEAWSDLSHDIGSVQRCHTWNLLNSRTTTNESVQAMLKSMAACGLPRTCEEATRMKGTEVDIATGYADFFRESQWQG